MLREQELFVNDVRSRSPPVVRKEHSAVLSCTYSGQCSVQLSVGEDRISDVDHCSVQREADAAIECTGISKAEWKLPPLNGPTGSLWAEVKADAGNGVGLGQHTRGVVDELDVYETAVKLLDHDSSILHQAFADGEVTHQCAHTSFFQAQGVWWDTVVGEQ
jgi:hypothetical protein